MLNALDSRFIAEDETRRQKADGLVKRIYERLHKHYPGHRWYVVASSEPKGPSVVTIRNLSMNAQQGMVMHTQNITDEMIKRYGGELLERYRLSRGRAKVSDLMSNKLIVDSRGNVMGET